MSIVSVWMCARSIHRPCAGQIQNQEHIFSYFTLLCEWESMYLPVSFVCHELGMFHTYFSVHLNSYFVVTLCVCVSVRQTQINITKYCNNLVLSFLLDFPVVVVSSILSLFPLLHQLSALRSSSSSSSFSPPPNRSIFERHIPTTVTAAAPASHIRVVVVGYRFHLPNLFHFCVQSLFQPI